ncbi:hypothetical protein QUF64_10015 [Anaerolineales bacterium HSG6]|nr:hypothetical protein [Anaerolineales bacterium HSG6]
MIQKKLYLSRPIKFWLMFFNVGLILLACSMGNQQSTAIPAGRPVEFEIQTASPTAKLAEITPTNTRPPQDGVILSLQDVPTHTPDPANQPTATVDILIATSTPTVLATATSEITVTATLTDTEKTEEVSETEETTDAIQVAPFDGELDPPLSGGNWDFEEEFVLWENPYGDCSGALVGISWSAFVEEGPLGSSCMGENLYPQDVQSGAKSQEVTFDFIAANSGIYRTIETKTGHRYNISAYAKHVRSLAPVEMSLGVDMAGGTVWNSESVEWTPWDDQSEDVFTFTEREVIATGDSMTIFVRGFHPQGDQGGKTYIDNVSVTHLGP